MNKSDLLKKYKHVFEQPVTLYENFPSPKRTQLIDEDKIDKKVYPNRIKECKETITEEKAVTLFAEAEVFDNYSGPGRIVKYKASGKNHLEAVKKIIDKLGFDITSRDIEKDSYDFEEVLEQIDMLNGEGDAFLINLKDDQGNEFYVHEGYEQDYEDLDESTDFSKLSDDELLHRYALSPKDKPGHIPSDEELKEYEAGYKELLKRRYAQQHEDLDERKENIVEEKKKQPTKKQFNTWLNDPDQYFLEICDALSLSYPECTNYIDWYNDSGAADDDGWPKEIPKDDYKNYQQAALEWFVDHRWDDFLDDITSEFEETFGHSHSSKQSKYCVGIFYDNQLLGYAIPSFRLGRDLLITRYPEPYCMKGVFPFNNIQDAKVVLNKINTCFTKGDFEIIFQLTSPGEYPYHYFVNLQWVLNSSRDVSKYFSFSAIDFNKLAAQIVPYKQDEDDEYFMLHQVTPYDKLSGVINIYNEEDLSNLRYKYKSVEEDLEEAKSFDFDKLNKKLHGNIKLKNESYRKFFNESYDDFDVDKYYDRMTVDEAAHYYGIDVQELIDDLIPHGYEEYEFVCCLTAKDEYYDALASNGVEDLILVKDTEGHTFPAQTSSDWMNDATSEIMRSLDLDEEELEEAKAFDFDKLNKKLHGNVKLKNESLLKEASNSARGYELVAKGYLLYHPYPTDWDVEDIAEEICANCFNEDYENCDPEISYACYEAARDYLDNAEEDLEEAKEFNFDKLNKKLHGNIKL